MKKKEIPKYKDNIAPISYADRKEENRRAKAALAEAHRQEEKYERIPVRINPYTTILVKHGKNIQRQVNRYKAILA